MTHIDPIPGWYRSDIYFMIHFWWLIHYESLQLLRNDYVMLSHGQNDSYRPHTFWVTSKIPKYFFYDSCVVTHAFWPNCYVMILWWLIHVITTLLLYGSRNRTKMTQTSLLDLYRHMTTSKLLRKDYAMIT